MSEQKQQWGSRLGVILAVAGSAVGLGNFLRFPGNAAQNGGGAFMIPYFIAFLVLGIPIGWAEWTMGRYGGRKGFHSAPAIMGVWGKGPVARYVGAFGVLIPIAVYFYYVIIESWCLCYAWNYLTGGIGVEPSAEVAAQVATSKDFFANVTFSTQDGFFADGKIHQSVWFFLITSVVNIFFVFRGLSKGIEKFCSWAMPAMAICALIVLVRVLTLPTDPAHPDQSVLAGLNFMWNPDFTKLSDPKTWLAAAGQIFFSLSVGFGVIINYASYMRKKDDVVLSGLTSSATNEFFEVALGGMITLTASVVFLGLAATQENTGGTFSTGFFALPVVFARMPAGNIFGAIWFFMLFLAAITSSLSMLQPTKAFVEEALGVSRAVGTTIVAAVALLGNVFVLWFSKGLVALDTIDFWVGTVMIFVVAGAQIICFAWVTGLEKGLKEAHEGAQIRIPGFIAFMMKWVSPAYLLVIFGMFCWSNMPGYWANLTWNEEQFRAAALKVGTEEKKLTGPELETFVATDVAGKLDAQPATRYSWGLILGTIGLLMATTAVGAKRWKAQGRDIDGQFPPDDETKPNLA
ncbi:MAG: sodium-dependent transporter [Planctomycetota bacterium]|nr:sodium-dependent transporter [Planctomycetota bacterium]